MSEFDTNEPIITGFHAHIYYDGPEIEDAREFAAEAHKRFAAGIGHFHNDPIGPHPRGSCQLTLTPENFGPFVVWAAEARGELTIMAHGLSGDDLADHTDHVIWFGSSEPLDLTSFQ